MRQRSGSRPPGPAELRSLVRPTAVVTLVLALIFVVGRVRIAQHAGGAPGSLGEAGLWPVGFCAGLTALALGRRQRVAALVAVVLVTLITGLTADLGAGPAAVLALGAASEAWVVARLVARSSAGRPRLMDHLDLVRLVVAGVAAAATGACIAGLAAALGVTEEPIPGTGLLVLVVAMTHLISHVLIVPFFMQVPIDPPTAGRGERALQGAVTVLVMPVLFLPDFPGTVFLVFPMLAWGVMRCGFRWSLAQSALLGVVASQLTLRGLGPFAASQPDLPSPFLGVVLLAGYVLCGVAVILPLALAIALQHRRAAEALEERQRAEGLVRSTVGTAIVATDLEGQVRLANPGAVDLFGYDAAVLVSLSVADLFPDGELADHARALGVPAELGAVMQAMSATPGERREWIVRRADGEARAHLLGFAHLADERGGVTGFVLTSEDITERIRVHESLVAALVAEHEVVKRMEELDGVKEALVSTVSHELRTPITSILGFVEMLQDGDYGRLSADQAQVVERVSDNGSRLLALIDDLLVMARLQSGVMELDLQPMDLRDTVRAAWQVLEPRLRDRELSVDMQLADGPMLLAGDTNQLERLVVNLIGNAIKFTPDGGRVVVRVAQVGERLVLEVSDTGIGIPEDEQEQLFSRFFRSRRASEQAIQGTGLGLSIVQAIAEQHGGSVAADSSTGRGTTFRVDLPASEPASVDVTTAPLPPPQTAEPTPASAAPVEPRAEAAGAGADADAPLPAYAQLPEPVEPVQLAELPEPTQPVQPAEPPEPEEEREPEEEQQPVEVPARLSAASRLAAARQSAGAADPGDSARAILDAFGPRPGRSRDRNI